GGGEARGCADPHEGGGGSGAHRGLDEVRQRLQQPIGIAACVGVVLRVERKLDSVGDRLRLVPAPALRRDLDKVDRLAADAELAAVHPCEIEDVAYQAFATGSFG